MSVLDLAYPRTYPDDKPHHTFIPPTSRPTIILVHGGWQGPETFSLIVPGLEKAGYSVFAVTLPSASVVPAVPNFSSDVAVIRNAVTSTLAIGKDVVLVMHSFGAVVGCEAMKEVKVDEASIEMETEGALRIGRVVRLAFIAGLLFPEGKATREESRGEDAIPGFHCQAVPYPIQKRFVAMARIHDVTTITSGHSPMVSQPKSVEVFIRKCAGEEVPKL
ncbi:MAG: hypothetical protein Q9196_004662 [Gyalolechia fulgens]